MRSHIPKASFFTGLAALAAMVAAGAASATPIAIFNNFSTGNTFDSTSSSYVSGSSGAAFAFAAPFTAGATADLVNAVLPLQGLLEGTNPITLNLESDGGGQPGSILASLAQQGSIPIYPDSPGLVTFDYTGSALQLTSGTAYWLVATQTDENSGASWYDSDDTTLVPVADNLLGSATGPWDVFPGRNTAFLINGDVSVTPPVVPTPEPGTLSLMTLALLGMFTALWIRSRRGDGNPS